MLSRADLEPKRWVRRLADGGRLLPFYKAVGVFFVAGGGAPSPRAVLLKVAPVLCLALSVALAARAAPPPRRRYGALVALGLALSAAGDALLVWPARLLAGMALFAAAHVAYILAFGLRPLAPRGLLAPLAAAALFVRLVRAPAALRPAVHAYAALLAAMAWRAGARAGAARAGALLFLASDALLAYGLFAAPVPHHSALVMSTYYLAQLGIALSALRPPAAQ